MATHNSIFAKLLGQGDYLEYTLADGATITPGMGVEKTNDSGTTKVQPVSTADANSVLVAREQRNPPKAGTGSPVDQDYETAGTNVECRAGLQNEQFRLRLAAGADLTTAANANVAEFDELGWNDDGTLVGGGSNALYEALEAVDNSGASAGENPLILVRQME